MNSLRQIPILPFFGTNHDGPDGLKLWVGSHVNAVRRSSRNRSHRRLFVLAGSCRGRSLRNRHSGAPEQSLSQGELDALVAPIALYPDALLAQVLMASTYPLEVVQADRWAKANKSLKGDKLNEALDKQDWDASVKELVSTPTVLAMMNDKLDWTQKLGDAVLAQQADVMDAIQRLRAKAQANGKLETTKQQKVTVTKEADQEVIVIEPTSPETVYVPYYDPAVVYGSWPYPDYPPYYFPPAPARWLAAPSRPASPGGRPRHRPRDLGRLRLARHDINVDIDKNVNIDKHVDRNNVKTGNGSTTPITARA